MPRRYESLETTAIRNLPVEVLKDLPSPVLQKAKNELAKHIQRTYRTRNYYATYRKGSKMTKKAMRRQLCNVEGPGDNLNSFLNFLKRVINTNISNNQQQIFYLINNLERPLLEKIYNNTFGLEDDEEDIDHINNSMYFPQTRAHGKRTRRKRKLNKKKVKKN